MMPIAKAACLASAIAGTEVVLFAQAGVEQLQGWGQYGVLGLFAGATIYLFFYVITKTLPSIQATFTAELQEQRKDFAQLTALQLQTHQQNAIAMEKRAEAFQTSLTADLKQLTIAIQEVRLRVQGCPVRTIQTMEGPVGKPPS